jgi:ribose/xylose/arabinose/galactoside ABC-type transport system permease subunit
MQWWRKPRREVQNGGKKLMLNLMEIPRPSSEIRGVGGASILKRRLREIPNDVLLLFIAFLVMCAFFAILRPQFLNFRNIINVLRTTAVVFILASGQTFAILSAGIDLSQGFIVGLVSVVTADIVIKHGVFWGIMAGLGAGTLAGLIMGLVVGKLRVQPFIATMGMIFIASGGALVYTGGIAIFGLDKPEYQSFFWFGGGYVGPIPVPVILAVIIFFLVYLLMYRTQFGRHVYAIGGNESAAVMSGVNAARVKILIYTFSGLMSTVGGIILTSRILSGQPHLGGFPLLMESIAAVVIGGTSLMGGEGGIFRTILGALFIGFLGNGLNLLGISTFVQQIVIGLIIILSVWISILRSRRT